MSENHQPPSGVSGPIGLACAKWAQFFGVTNVGISEMVPAKIALAKKAGANVIVTACPFCLVNMEDAIKVAGMEGEMEANSDSAYVYFYPSVFSTSGYRVILPLRAAESVAF